METNQKNRDTARKRRPQQEAKARPVAEQQGTKRRSGTSGQNGAQPRREGTQRKAADRPAASRSAQKRPVSQAQAPRQTAQRSSAQQTAQRPPRREEQVPRSAPQGTGPRKSAPQRTAQEQAAAKRSAAAKRAAAPKQEPKKNPLQSLLAGNSGKNEGTRSEQAKRRQEERAAKAERRRRQAERNNTPAVIYTAPTPFNRNRLLVQLMTIMAVVIALVLGLSVFFKVKTVTVAGAEVYSAYAVAEASGIAEGDNLMTFSRSRAGAQIQAKLPYVEKVRIGIKLPDTVIIYIEEIDVAYAIQSEDGTWWLMNSNGKLVEQINSATATGYTQVLGVTLSNPKPGEDAIAAEEVTVEADGTEATEATEEVVPITVTGAQRLYSALQILKALEANDIVGEAASVNVSRLEDIVLWYGTRYQVNLGDTSQMEYKIACMNDVILQMSDYQSGVLDISFTTWKEQVGYTPFE